MLFATTCENNHEKQYIILCIYLYYNIIANTEGAFHSFRQKFQNFSNGYLRTKGNFPGKFLENLKVFEFLKCKLLN